MDEPPAHHPEDERIEGSSVEGRLRDRAEAIVIEALDRPVAMRAALVVARCAGDRALRALVDSLLAQVPHLDGFLDAPIDPSGRARSDADPGLPPGHRIGAWRIVDEIGRGGMGLVYAVERDDGVVAQRAALKLIKRGMDSDAIVARFRTERQILAALDHPDIARLIDAGATDDGRPYLVMERVDGLPLDRWCAVRGASIEERIALFVEICAAVQYAHQRLVVHRDLKPTNSLVTAAGRPKLLDFGIARLLATDGAPDPATDATVDANRLLTPRYASPEQLAGAPVSTASDVYALGVLLYELLTGRTPYRVATTSIVEMMRAITEQDPLRPSLAVTQASSGGDPKPGDTTIPLASEAVEKHGRRVAQRLRGDLDHIVLKALAKDVRERYGSAAELRDDLTRHLAGQVILATAPTWRYRARKFVGRHRAAVAAGAIAVVALVVGTGVASWQAVRADRQRDLAEARFQDTRKLARSMLFEINDELASGPTAARAKLVRTALEYLDRLSAGRLEPDLQRDVAEGYERIADIVGNAGENNLGRPDEAKRYRQQALAMRQRLYDAHPDDPVDVRGMYTVNIRLGEALRYTGPADEAARWFAAAERLAEREHALQPDDARAATDVFVARRYVAGILYTSGRPNLHRPDEARVRFVSLVADLDGYLATHETTPRLASVLNVALQELTTLQIHEGDTVGAATTSRRSLRIAGERLARSPENSVAIRDVGLNERKLAEILVDLGQFDEGLDLMRRAIARMQAQATSDPSNSRAQRDVGIAHGALSTMDESLGRYPEALTEARAFVAGAERLVAADPNNESHRLDLNDARVRIAAAHLGLGDVATASSVARAGAQEIVRHDGQTPEEPRARENLGELQLIEARALAAMRRPADGWPLGLAGVAALRANVAIDPGDAEVIREFARAAIEAGTIGLAVPSSRVAACTLVLEGRDALRSLKEEGRSSALYDGVLQAADRRAVGCVKPA